MSFGPNRILVLKGKHGDYPVFARTPEEELRAYLTLFNHLDEVGYYQSGDLGEPEWYKAAKEGDGQAAKWLMGLRSDLGYEYECVSVEYVEEPA